MKYILVNSEGTQYWLEIGSNGYALRQIIIEQNKQIQVSCLEDCLAEGVINEDEFLGKVNIITQSEFESKWNIVLVEKRKKWDILKKKYPSGMIVKGKVRYFYPQGCILEIEELLGVCDIKSAVYPNEYVRGKVSGYDEVNMWLLISNATKV